MRHLESPKFLPPFSRAVFRSLCPSVVVVAAAVGCWLLQAQPEFWTLGPSATKMRKRRLCQMLQNLKRTDNRILTANRLFVSRIIGYLLLSAIYEIVWIIQFFCVVFKRGSFRKINSPTRFGDRI